MQAYLRERLVEELLKLHDLANRYPQNSPGFIQQTLSWMKGLEQVLTRLRHPLAGTLASRRMLLESALDGHVDTSSHSRRKAARFRAVDLLAEAEAELRNEVERIDRQFNEWRDKIAQLAALASSQQPLPISDPLVDAQLKLLWHQMGTAAEGANMHRYLSAVMPEADLLYLLRDVLNNLLSHGTD